MHLNQIQSEPTLVIAKLGLFVCVISIILFIVFWFGPTDLTPFEAGEELIVGPLLSLISVIISSIAYFRTNKKISWHYLSITLGTIIFLLWTGFSSVFIYAYSNCPNGVC